MSKLIRLSLFIAAFAVAVAMVNSLATIHVDRFGARGVYVVARDRSWQVAAFENSTGEYAVGLWYSPGAMMGGRCDYALAVSVNSADAWIQTPDYP